MSKLLTIIVPMYNVGEYLEECISHIRIKDIDYEIWYWSEKYAEV